MGLLEARDTHTSDLIFVETAGFVQHCTLFVVHANIGLNWLCRCLNNQVKNYYRSTENNSTDYEQPEEVSTVRYVNSVIENTFKVLIAINIDPL